MMLGNSGKESDGVAWIPRPERTPSIILPSTELDFGIAVVGNEGTSEGNFENKAASSSLPIFDILAVGTGRNGVVWGKDNIGNRSPIRLLSVSFKSGSPEGGSNGVSVGILGNNPSRNPVAKFSLETSDEATVGTLGSMLSAISLKMLS